MAHRRQGSKGFQKSIKTIRWDGSSHVFDSQAAGSAAQTFITDGSTETLLRIRGELVASLDATQTPGTLINVGIGLLVVQGGSSTVVINKPITDADAPWLWYERFVLGYEEMVTDVIDVPQITSIRKVIDNKAMRILRPGREVQLVIENVTLAGSGAVNLTVVHRTLLGNH